MIQSTSFVNQKDQLLKKTHNVKQPSHIITNTINNASNVQLINSSFLKLINAKSIILYRYVHHKLLYTTQALFLAKNVPHKVPTLILTIKNVILVMEINLFMILTPNNARTVNKIKHITKKLEDVMQRIVICQCHLVLHQTNNLIRPLDSNTLIQLWFSL